MHITRKNFPQITMFRYTPCKQNLGHFILKITYSLQNSNTGFDTIHIRCINKDKQPCASGKSLPSVMTQFYNSVTEIRWSLYHLTITDFHYNLRVAQSLKHIFIFSPLQIFKCWDLMQILLLFHCWY